MFEGGLVVGYYSTLCSMGCIPAYSGIVSGTVP